MKIIAALAAFFFAANAHAETVLVTGANRGIGFEFVRQYAARGWDVIATARDPTKAAELQALANANTKIQIAQLDVADDASIKALAAKYKDRPIDVLINNAGLLGDLKTKQRLGTLDRKEFELLMTVNVFGALAVSEAFIENVARSTQKKIVAISSGNGSVSAEKVPGGLYFYPASKAALNITMRGLQDQLASKGIAVAALAPGGVDTDMGRTAGGNKRPENIPASQSVGGMLKVIDQLTPQNTNVFYRYDGTTRPW